MLILWNNNNNLKIKLHNVKSNYKEHKNSLKDSVNKKSDGQMISKHYKKECNYSQVIVYFQLVWSVMLDHLLVLIDKKCKNNG